MLAYLRGHIRWKIILPFATLSIVVALAGTYLTTRLVAGSLGERFENQLAEAARVTSDAFARRERRHLEVVRAVTFTEGVGATVAAGEGAALERLVLPQTVNAGAQRMEVLDAFGGLLYGAKLLDSQQARYARIAAGEAYVDWPMVQSVLRGVRDERGDKFASLVATTDGWVLYSAGPVMHEGNVVGAVLVGSDLKSLLAAVKLESISDVTVYAPGGLPLASTFAVADAETASELHPTPHYQQVDGKTVVRETKSLFGRNFDLLYGELNLRGEPVALYSVGLPSSFIATAASLTRWQMTVLFSLATGAVLLIGWYVAAALTRPIQRLAVTARAVGAGDLSARSGLDTRDEIGQLAHSFDAMTGKLQRQHLGTVKALASAIDARDPYTLGHSVRVGQLAAQIGVELRLPRVDLQHLEIGGYLHDIGKIGIRDSVLLKPGKLTDDERLLIEDHPTIGLKILDSIELPDEVRQFVASHHEKLDGSGYPEGLDSQALTIYARVGAVSDIYDALITDRPYRTAMTLEQVLEMLTREARQGLLDPDVVNALTRVAPAWEELRRLDPALQGTVLKPLYDSLPVMA